MARLSVSDLVEAVMRDPRYSKWEKQVPASTALHVTFHTAPIDRLRTVVNEAVDGRVVILEIGPDGKVYGIEIT
jgi:hypothetical protein